MCLLALHALSFSGCFFICMMLAPLVFYPGFICMMLAPLVFYPGFR